MARIKFGSIVVEGSGSLGGHTFQNSNGGAQLRTKPINKKKPTEAQRFIRSCNPQLQKGWRSLTSVQRLVWNKFAVTHGKFNKKGDKHHLSGHSLYMQYNFLYISCGQPLITSPFDYSSKIPGTELVRNGSFVDSAFWATDANFSIGGGSANYNALGFGNIRQTLTITNGVEYRISFDISIAATFARMAILDITTAPLFASPYNTYKDFVNGSYCYDVYAIKDTTQIRVLGNAAGSSFSLDNLSIKQLFE